MRVLFVTPLLPVPPDNGGAQRIFGLIQQVRQDHHVTVLSLVGPDDDVSEAERMLGRLIAVPVAWTARQPPNAARRRAQLRSLVSLHSAQRRLMAPPALQSALDSLLARESFDVMQCEFAPVGLLHTPTTIPRILDAHNIEHDLLRQIARQAPLLRQLFNMLEWRKLAREERAAWRQATHCLATSEADAATIRSSVPTPVSVIPNGVDLAALPLSPLSLGKPERLVFVGTLRYWPNVEGVTWLLRQVLPHVRAAIPSVEVTIVGSDPPPALQALARAASVRLTGRVPEVTPWITRAGIVVVPLRSGGGTRLKILEAFALGRPVVSTSIGAAGLDVCDGQHLLLADTPEAFADAIVRLIRDAALRSQLVAAARQLVVERYDWARIGAQYRDVLAHVVAQSTTRSN